LVFESQPPAPAVAVAVSGFLLGWLVLFLVTSRGNIYLGSNLDDVDTNVTTIVDKSDTGNEYIYGDGAITASRRRNQYFWMRRYLAQVLVRLIPSSVWPTKYEDVGLPEIARNAGTSEGFRDALGWVGAVGSAPGIVADLWVEVSWFAVVLMALLGWCYGSVWRKAVTAGPAWSSQYVILAALSLYMVICPPAITIGAIRVSASRSSPSAWAMAPGSATKRSSHPRLS
jgi:hypothetical protein